MSGLINEKIRESHLTCFGHVLQRAINAPAKKGKGLPKIALVEVVKKNMSIKKIISMISVYKQNKMVEKNTCDRFYQTVTDLKPNPKNLGLGLGCCCCNHLEFQPIQAAQDWFRQQKKLP